MPQSSPSRYCAYTRFSLMRRLLLTLLTLLVSFAGCGRSEIYREPDDGDVFGLDGGRRRDGGTDGGDPWFECDVETQLCPGSGEACFYYRLSDGGIGSHCVVGDCDLVSQNCPGGSKCDFSRLPDGGTRRICVPAGARTEGQPCLGDSLSNDCARGLSCAPRGFEDGGSERICRKYCFASSSCQLPQICYALVSVPGIREIPLTCENAPTGCSLLGQNCPRAGEACYPGQSQPLCFPEGTIATGGACFFSNECREGAACFNGRCRVMCAFPSGNPSCTSPAQCRETSGVPGVDGGLGACF